MLHKNKEKILYGLFDYFNKIKIWDLNVSLKIQFIKETELYYI